MNTPVNLNRVRKETARADKKARADENAVKFGQTSAQKDTLKARAEQIKRNLDGHKKDS